MSRTKAIIVVERRELELGEAENGDDAVLLSFEEGKMNPVVPEGKPVVGLVLSGVGVVLMVLSFSLPS